MSQEEYELKQEYLTSKSDRQQYHLEVAQHTDAAIVALSQGDISDITHTLVVQHPDIASALLMDLKYYKDNKVF